MNLKFAFRIAVAAGLLVTALAGAAEKKPKPAATPPAAVAAATPEAPINYLVPPDGKWLKDAAGLEYFVMEIPRVEGGYIWTDEKHTKIRLSFGLPFDVVKSDAKTFHVKVYRTPDDTVLAKPVVPPAAPAAPAAPLTHRLQFTDFSRGLPTAGQWRNGFVVVDFDGDGKLDIVHGPSRKGNGEPTVFLGNGKGDWTPKRLHLPRASHSYDYGDIAVADFNGDGKMDIALASHLRGVVVLVNDGKGGYVEWSRGIFFQVPGSPEYQSGFTSQAIVAADWNGDGRPDLIALGEGPRLMLGQQAPGKPALGFTVFLNNGDGTWTTLPDPQDLPGKAIFGNSMAVRDLDGDGHPDALLASNVLGLTQLLRWQGDAGAWTSGSITPPDPKFFAFSVAVDDLDGDGRPDLLLGLLTRENDQWVTSIEGYFNRSNRTFERRRLWSEPGRAAVGALAAGDLNGDGHRDVVALTNDGRTVVLLGDGAGGFSQEDTTELNLYKGCLAGHVAIADLDGDGLGEIVESFAGESAGMPGIVRPVDASAECPTEGAIRVWKPTVRPPASPGGS